MPVKKNPTKKSSTVATKQRAQLHEEILELQELIDHQASEIEKLNKRTQKIYKKVNVMSIINWIKIAIIMIPVILGLIYLPPLFKEGVKKYELFVGELGKVGTTIDTIRSPRTVLESALNKNSVSSEELSNSDAGASSESFLDKDKPDLDATKDAAVNAVNELTKNEKDTLKKLLEVFQEQ